VILESMPSFSEGSLRLEAIQVEAGSPIVDASGFTNTLAEGVRYRPSGCTQQACALTYTGDQPAMLDQWVVDFRLLDGLRWSDGSPLTSDDSVYSYEVAWSFYQASAPAALPDLLLRTASYRALDERTVEWVGIPGYLEGEVSGKFFWPLPRHAWGAMPVTELRTSEIATRQPLGWGPYVIEEWVGGDHLTLAKNPNYIRASQGLPRFDHLVFRFVANGQEGLQALLAGECDLLEAGLKPELTLDQLDELEAQGKLRVNLLPETAWEMVLFGIDSLDESRPSFFTDSAVRQAVSLCLDREAVVEQVFQGKAQVAASYLPGDHPLFDPNLASSGYDPGRGSQLLEEAGWVDQDGDPTTPRLAQGIAQVADGTLLEIEYLVSAEGERPVVAQVLQASLKKCGIGLKITPQEAAQYLAPGPDGSVFGRKFSLAQFAWPLPQIPLCGLFLSQEIPGAYPEYPRGWGGANASGYRREEFDQACLDGLYALPEMAGYQEANRRAQELFMEDLPAAPLYWRFTIELARPDLCGMAGGGGARSSLEKVEELDYGEGCDGR
jgi:peptide/nickel transport system substrate-binding protein